MEPQELWWAQAGPARFVKKIVSGIIERRRVLCVTTPVPRPTALVDALRSKLNVELSLETAIVDLSARDQSGSIAHLVAEDLDVSPVEIGSVADFSRHPRLADTVIIVDGIDKAQLRRWSLFLRQVQAEGAADSIIGPIVIALLPRGLTKEETNELCASARLFSFLGIVDRYDTASYASALGIRPADDLPARVGHAVMLDVAAWSKEVIETIMMWEVSDQIDPMPLLQRAADKSGLPYPCWENGLVDLWDDEPAAHAVAAVKFGLRDHVKRRIWAAQAAVLLPFSHRILRSLIARYHDVLSRVVSPQKPLRKKFNDREYEITDPWKLEFYDFKELTSGHISPGELELVKIANWTRNAVAHRDVVTAAKVNQFSEHYETNRDILDNDVPGWNWPRCGQKMTLTVGPSAAGKSHWSSAQGVEVVSSDEIRKSISIDGEIPGSQAGIFQLVRAGSSRVLCAGRDVIVDAMHLEAEHRIRQANIAPPDVTVRYVIIDRPLADKLRDAGWRGGRGIVEKYDQAFAMQIQNALRGDSIPNVEVLDLRNGPSEPRS
ncbi:MAG: ATP-binding protein [Gemmataceae bacterium]|nr:ATP-binding protein [Gemmataceae bacterium]